MAEMAPALSGAKNYQVRVKGTPIVPVAMLGIGAYLAWFGVHYWRTGVKWPSDPVKAVLNGQPLPDNTVAPPTVAGQLGGVPTPGGPAVPPSTTDAIANAALKYVGAGYNWAGPADRVGNWDCSSFVSKVLGQDLGLPLPGGGKWGDPGYPPNSHGPGSTQYMLYGQGVDHAHVQAGDLVVSVEHIGIAISPTQMVSAQMPSTGTTVSGFPVDFPAGPPVYRRVQLSPLFRLN